MLTEDQKDDLIIQIARELVTAYATWSGSSKTFDSLNRGEQAKHMYSAMRVIKILYPTDTDGTT